MTEKLTINNLPLTINKVPEFRFSEFSSTGSAQVLGEWATEKLGKLASVKTGDKDTQDRIDKGTYPFFVRSNTVERISSYSFDGEAILTSGDGVGVGKNFHYINGKFNYHQRVYCISNFTNRLDGKFFYHYFVEKFYRRVMRLSAKNSVDSVRMSMITDMEIPTPSLPEQQKIATFLSAVDKKLGHLRRKHALLETYKRGIMQKIFPSLRQGSGQARPELRFKQDDGADFPDWEENHLGELGSFKNGFNADKSAFGTGTEFVNLMDIFGKSEIKLTPLDRVEINEKQLEDYKIKKGDILFVRSSVKRTGVGQSCLVNDDFVNTIYSGFIIRFRQNANKLFEQYQKYCFSSVPFRKKLLSLATSSANTNINQESLAKILLSYPELKEQQKIANFLSTLDKKLETVQAQINQTETFKKVLLQKVFV